MIRPAESHDLEAMLDLAVARRAAYEPHSPVFWRIAPDARERQKPFFEKLLADSNHICLVFDSGEEIRGFLIGRVANPPPVFAREGKDFLIDDFTVKDPSEWPTTGALLYEEAFDRAQAAGAGFAITVCALHDTPKREMVRTFGVLVTSEWLARPLEQTPDTGNDNDSEGGVRLAGLNDLEGILDLAEQDRGREGQRLPEFNRFSPDVREQQKASFENFIADSSRIVLVAKHDGQLVGFLIALLLDPPPVYAPDGKASLVDVFAIRDNGDWQGIGAALHQEIAKRSAAAGAAVLVTICSPANNPKREMLQAHGNHITSEFYAQHTQQAGQGGRGDK